MRLLVLNPNTSATMTANVVAQVRALARPDVVIGAATADTGCAVIDTPERYALGAVAALATFEREIAAAPWDAVLLACFGDPGLGALRRHSSVCIVGLAEAALRDAADIGESFGILTCGPAWPDMLNAYVAGSGFGQHYRGTWALPFHGGALVADPVGCAPAVRALATAAADAGVRTLIAGGAAFAGLTFGFDPRLRILDPIHSAVRHLGVGR